MDKWLLPAVLLLSVYTGIRCALSRRPAWQAAAICVGLALTLVAGDVIDRLRAHQRQVQVFRTSPPESLDFPEGPVQGTPSADGSQVTFKRQDGRTYVVGEPSLGWTFNGTAWYRAGFTFGLGLLSYLIARFVRKK